MSAPSQKHDASHPRQGASRPMAQATPFQVLGSRHQRELFSQMCALLGDDHKTKRHLLLTR